MALTPEKFLLCLNVPLARTGTQRYRQAEVAGSGDDLVEVYRSPAEVFDKAAVASFEGKPVVSPHPPTFLTPDNAVAYSKGHVQNIREGERLSTGERVLVGDLLVMDSFLISQIQNGLRDVSIGYSCAYVRREDGTFAQTNIRANHIAVVPEGRAGPEIRIMDAESAIEDFGAIARRYHRENISSVKPLQAKFAARVAVVDSEEKIMSKQRDEEYTLADVSERLDRAIELMEQFIAAQTRDTRLTRTNGKAIDWDAPARRRSLDDDARRTTGLSATGVGPGEFHKSLAAHNAAYAEFSSREDADQAFADAANEAGRRMRGETDTRDCRPSLRRSAVSDADSADYAELVNAAGRRMRGK